MRSWLGRHGNKIKIGVLVEVLVSVLAIGISWLFNWLLGVKDILIEIFSYSMLLNLSVIAILITVLIVSMFFLIFKRKVINKVGYTFFSFILILPILLAILISFPTCHLYKISDKSVVVVAEFDDIKVTKEKADIRKRICETLEAKKEKEGISTLIIQKAPKVIQDKKEAKRTGNKEKAKTVIVIWGWYDDYGIHANFKIVRAPNEEIKGISTSVEKEREPTISGHNREFSLYIRRDLPQIMAYLTGCTIGMVYYFGGDYKNAINQIGPSLEHLLPYMKSPALHFYLANAYYYQGDMKSAEENYIKAMQINQALDPDALNKLGVVCYKQGQIEKAISCFNTAIKINREYVDAWYNLGVVYKKQGQIERAIEYYNTAIQINPKEIRALDNLAIIYEEQGKIEKALEYSTKSISIDPNNANGWNNCGHLYERKRQFKEAITCFKKAIKINPKYVEAYYNLGVVYEYNAQGKRYESGARLNEAIKHYEKALRIDPKYALAQYNLGWIYIKQNQIKNALLCFNEITKINPKDAKAWLALGVIYQECGKIEESNKCFKEALKINSEDVEALSYLGRNYGFYEQFEKAIKCLNKTIQINPEYAEAWCNLGWSYERHGYPEKAIECYNKSIELNSKLGMAHFNYAKLLYWKGNEKYLEHVQKAMHYLKKEIETIRNPSYKANWYECLGISCLWLGDKTEAKVFFTKAIKTAKTVKKEIKIYSEKMNKYVNKETFIRGCKEYIELKVNINRRK